MVEHPAKGHDRRVELAHEVLADVVDAVLVVALVHLRDVVLEGLHVGRDGEVVVLPDVVQAVDGVGAHGGGGVAATADVGGVPDRGEVVADAEDVAGRDADLAV